MHDEMYFLRNTFSGCFISRAIVYLTLLNIVIIESFISIVILPLDTSFRSCKDYSITEQRKLGSQSINQHAPHRQWLVRYYEFDIGGYLTELFSLSSTCK